MESGRRFQVKIQANNASPMENCVVYMFPIARLASLAIITPAVVVYPIAVAMVVAGMPPVTVIVLYPPFGVVWMACVVWIVWIVWVGWVGCTVCIVCVVWTVCVVAGVLTKMSVGVIVTPIP
jgi:hypothetical protein